MTEQPWFGAKRYGYGAGLPISRQGWLVTLIFMIVAIGAGMLFADRPLALAAVLLPAILIFIIIAMRTTEGGWRWRWGGRD
ncbi:MAG: hypothetical protein ABR588_03860 [Sphingomicrobium sp.]|nr:hypothetical protein [Sphingomonadales bacterium]